MQTLNGMKQQLFSILLVEDDDVDVMNIKRAFKKNELQVPIYRATNGLEALDMLHEKIKHNDTTEKLVIFLDINMPKMNGIEFLQILRKDTFYRSLPVIILTTSDQPQDIQAAYNLNVAGYILKPIEFDRFVEVMKVVSSYWSFCTIMPL